MTKPFYSKSLSHSMQRRFLPALKDNKNRDGAFATVWEGWVNPRGRSFDIGGRVNPTRPYDFDKVEDRVGVYAVLYEPGTGTRYVAYIGVSKWVRSELAERYRGWGVKGESYLPYTVQYIHGLATAKAVESDLIRYYCPPWNVSFR